MYDEVKVYLQQLLDMNIIMPSHSPWASNVVLVKKKDNSLRMCVDFVILKDCNLVVTRFHVNHGEEAVS
jgi:hypothetical protein